MSPLLPLSADEVQLLTADFDCAHLVQLLCRDAASHRLASLEAIRSAYTVCHPGMAVPDYIEGLATLCRPATPPPPTDIELIAQRVAALERLELSRQERLTNTNATPPADSPTVGNDALPSELATPTAMGYWQRLYEAGLVGADCQRCEGISRQTSMYIADCFADSLGLQYRWAPFEKFWNIQHLAAEKLKMHDSGNRPKHHEIIDDIFA